MKIINIIKKTKKIIKIRIQLLFNKCRVAENPNTPPEVLEKLANDVDYWVRYGVAENPNTPPKVLEQLATDEDYIIRCYVAKNPNTLPEVLEKLANDEDLYVRWHVALNPNTLKYIKTYLLYQTYLNCYENH
jgi:3-methyladenine DNA glycosylase AlkC